VLLLDAIGTRPDDWRRFLTTLARVQGRQILANTTSPPRPGSKASWAAEIGAMDALLGEVLALPGNGRLRDSVTSFSDAVIRAVNGGDQAAVARALDSSYPGTVTGELLRDGSEFAIAAGYVQNHVLTVPAAYGTHGRIPPLTALQSDPQAQLSRWIGTDKPYLVLEPALESADPAFTAREVRCCAD
jgi:hypothetical protein